VGMSQRRAVYFEVQGWALGDIASIILGKIDASEHQELCWKNS